MNLKHCLLACLCFWTFNSCKSQFEEILDDSEMINGISLVASRNNNTTEQIGHITNINANYSAVIPFGFLRSLDSPTVNYNIERQWLGERVAGVKHSINMLHEANIKVMLKPQIWIGGGDFTGDMKMTNEANWKTLEETYEAYILLYAEVAQEMNVELFCIGTELYNFVNARPDFWRQLISKVKTVYSGKLTYAENWDKVDKVSIWEDLDYIGSDAYYPISEAKTPTVDEARQGWQQWKTELKSLSDSFDRPVLFTEFGYRSLDFAGRKPWESNRVEGQVNHAAQVNLTQALFEEFWDEDWFAGGFIWKWFPNHEYVGGLDNNRFTPQNKPAEDLIKTHYAKY